MRICMETSFLPVRGILHGDAVRRKKSTLSPVDEDLVREERFAGRGNLLSRNGDSPCRGRARMG